MPTAAYRLYNPIRHGGSSIEHQPSFIKTYCYNLVLFLTVLKSTCSGNEDCRAPTRDWLARVALATS
eukprot:5099899-Pleurochrysis_carterae.AAC.1